MPETAAAIGTYFSASEGAAAVLTAEDIAVAGTSVVGTGTAAGGATIGVAGTGTTASAAAAGVVGGSFLSQAGKAAGSAAVTAGMNAALAPKRPDLPKPLAMPDPVAQEEARKRSIIEQMSRRGRSSTILTDAGSGTLGG
jgi:hypothetical protein